MKSAHYLLWPLIALSTFLTFFFSNSRAGDATSRVELKQLIQRGEDVIWLHADQIKVRGTSRLATLVYEGANPGIPEAKSAIGRYEMGCERRTVRRLYLRHYAGAALSGALLKSEAEEKKSRRVEGESLEEVIWNYICFRLTPTTN